MGFFTTLNSMNSYASQVLCSEDCPCALKIVIPDDYDVSVFLDEDEDMPARLLQIDSDDQSLDADDDASQEP